MRHPSPTQLNQGQLSPSAAGPRSPSGFTLIESLVAVIIVGITVVSILPPIFWATATRVQNRRAEQAVQLAQSEIERVRTLVERGSYGVADLPPVDGARTTLRDEANPVPAPSTLSGIKRSTRSGCNSADDARQPTAVTQVIEIDSDPKSNDCKPEFMVQVFRSGGTIPVGSPVGTAPSAFSMGVRVYAAPAFANLGRLETKAARLRGSSGPGQQGIRPLAVLYGTVVNSRKGDALGVYKKLCLENKDC
jgi:prepilin-type N-terminal cleavage/methylation domain-containing protein